MAQKDEYSRQSSKQNGKVHILLIVFSVIHFHFYVFPMPGLVLFDVVDKNLQVFPHISRFFDFDLQVFWSFGVEGSALYCFHS